MSESWNIYLYVSKCRWKQILCKSYIHNMIFIMSVFKMKQGLSIALGPLHPPTKNSGCAHVAQFWWQGLKLKFCVGRVHFWGHRTLGFCMLAGQLAVSITELGWTLFWNVMLCGWYLFTKLQKVKSQKGTISSQIGEHLTTSLKKNRVW